MTSRHLTDSLQCAIPAFESLLPEPHNAALLKVLYSFAQWHALAKLRLHNDFTLKQSPIVYHHLPIRETPLLTVEIVLPDQRRIAPSRKYTQNTPSPCRPRRHQERPCPPTTGTPAAKGCPEPPPPEIPPILTPTNSHPTETDEGLSIDHTVGSQLSAVPRTNFVAGHLSDRLYVTSFA